ncbi:MAG: ATPase [Planctomycetes bacterium]|nr:ATPase [Planctomycetota bacterium]
MKRRTVFAAAMAALGLGMLGLVALAALAGEAAPAGEKVPAGGEQAAGAGSPASGTAADENSVYRSLGLALAAAAVGSVTILGASYAVARVGSAAMGAMAERPELGFRAVVVVALAEGLAILGFAIAVLLSNKIV